MKLSEEQKIKGAVTEALSTPQGRKDSMHLARKIIQAMAGNQFHICFAALHFVKGQTYAEFQKLVKGNKDGVHSPKRSAR